MKRIYVLLLLAALVAASAWAKPGGDRQWGPPDAERRVERMSQELDLSEEQASRLLEIFEAADAERQAIHEAYRAQMEPEVCALHESVQAQVHNVLDDGQSAQFDEMTARFDERRASRGGRHGPAPPDCSRY
jgi:Spy/CpxP family protein refolding chaperone